MARKQPIPGNHFKFRFLVVDDNGDPYDVPNVRFHYSTPTKEQFTKSLATDDEVSRQDEGDYLFDLYVPYEVESVGMWNVDAEAIDIDGKSVRTIPAELYIYPSGALQPQ